MTVQVMLNGPASNVVVFSVDNTSPLTFVHSYRGTGWPSDRHVATSPALNDDDPSADTMLTQVGQSAHKFIYFIYIRSQWRH